MKRPDSFLTNTIAPAGRSQGQAINDPGGGSGSGVDQEIYNDPAYAVIAVAESWKEGGISDSDEKTTSSDMRDAIEEMAGKKVSGISEWLVGTTYSAPGTITDLVMWKGFQFINISNVGNLGNDPLLNPDLWFKIPNVDTLMDLFFNGEPVSGGLSPLNDRAGAKYLQNCLFGKFRLGGNGDDFYEFYRVALDGTVVTGDTTLETIFDVGGGSEYFNLDLIAPDVLGTRTLIDMGGRTTRAQSSGGKADTMAEVQEDAMQQITGRYDFRRREGDTTTYLTDLGVFTYTGSVGSSIASMQNGPSSYPSDRLSFNSADSVSPNTAKTDPDETRMANIVTGIRYLIIMKAA